MKPIEHAEGLFIPTVNQLRYAGWHIKNYLINKDEEELKKAKRHCKRAIYDACDARIQYALSEIEALQSDFKHTPISDTFSDYLDMIDLKNKIIEFLGKTNDTHDDSDTIFVSSEEGGEQANKGKRDEFYLDCSKFAEKIESYVAKLPVVRDELNIKTNDIINNKKQARLGIIVGVSGLILPYLSSILNWFISIFF
jgi:hypothetical protein